MTPTNCYINEICVSGHWFSGLDPQTVPKRYTADLHLQLCTDNLVTTAMALWQRCESLVMKTCHKVIAVVTNLSYDGVKNLVICLSSGCHYNNCDNFVTAVWWLCDGVLSGFLKVTGRWQVFLDNFSKFQHFACTTLGIKSIYWTVVTHGC